MNQVNKELIQHRYFKIIEEALNSGDWKGDNPQFVLEDSGIEWRLQSSGISFIFALYKQNDDIFVLLDATICNLNSEALESALTWSAEEQLSLPYLKRIGVRKGYNGAEVACQIWSEVSILSDTGFKFRLKTFKSFSICLLNELADKYGVQPFLFRTS